MSECIPFEIQMEIIEKVCDVKSLIRFRSVSKRWKLFIGSPDFIKGYGARHTQPQSRILRYINNYSDEEVKYICFVDDDDDDDQNNETFKVFTRQIKQFDIAILVGACHGLLCLYGCYEKWMFVIWNPSIRQSIGVVPPPCTRRMSSFAFGVCPVTRDPTIVKLTHSHDATLLSVEVFTLSSGVWNVIPSSNSPRKSIQFKNSTHIVIDRFIYWVACETTTQNDILVSFDLITKEFRVLDLPHSLTNELHVVSVSKLRDSLVVYGDIMVEGALCYGVWVMEHDLSFRKLFTIDADPVVQILGFRNNGELILEAWDDNEELTTLVVYNICSFKWRVTHQNHSRNTRIVRLYLETLQKMLKGSSSLSMMS